MPSLHPPLPLPRYRLFHLSARLRLRPSPSSHRSPPPTPPTDDYYALLLSTPLPTPAPKPITPTPAPTPTSEHPQPSSSSVIETSTTSPEPRVLFSKALEGPSPRMRGLARAEQGLQRPAEPDNCCMSGCVNCVWDAYREEVEEWARERRRREGVLVGMGLGREDGEGGGGSEEDGGGVGDLDRGFEGVEVGEEDIFEGVPVGIREFMNTEKRLRERRREEGESGRGRERAVA